MAKIVPTHGFLLSGRFQNGVFCVKANGTGYVRTWVRPKDARTNVQIAQRGRFGAAIAAWKALPEDERKKYRDRARFMGRTGYHLFVGEFIAGQGDGDGPG